jgi:hypothetical protein
MIPTELTKELHEIPESVIKAAAEHIGGNNQFAALLEKAAIFRHVGAKPIYLANEDASAMCVSSKETYNRKLH